VTDETRRRLGLNRESFNAWKHDHRLALMIFGSIVMSLALVVVSMYLYSSSGAAQLDLSRPGYSSVRGRASSNDKIDTFPSSGTITKETIQEFEALYSRYADEATAIDAFGGDVLNNRELGIDGPQEP